MSNNSFDTCVILAHILGEPIEQRDAVWSLLEDPIVVHHIPDLAISEAVHVLETRYEYSREEISYHMNKFLAKFDDVLEYNRSLFWLVFPFYERHPALSFNDCMMAFYAEIGQAEPLLTFDKTLARQHPSAKLL